MPGPIFLSQSSPVNKGLVILFNTIIPIHLIVSLLFQIYDNCLLNKSNQCVHREGFNHSYAIKYITMVLIMKKSLFYQINT